jgi:hypothetical protein
VVPSNGKKKTGSRSYGGYAWAEPTAVTATATPAAGTHKRQISEAVSRDECPNRPETTPCGAAAITGFPEGVAQEA